MQLSAIKDLIQDLLKNQPHLRDDDFKLIATVYSRQARQDNIDLHQITAFEFLKMFCNNKDIFTSPEAICRCRRKWQELCPELRGEKWQIRHDESITVKQDIREFNGYSANAPGIANNSQVSMFE